MPIPWEVTLPFIAIAAMFNITAYGSAYANRLKAPEHMPNRWCLDNWDEAMMERDRRLTGSFRGQRDDPIAPPEFSTNHIWERQNPTATWLKFSGQ